jgi:hypothetical protein
MNIKKEMKEILVTLNNELQKSLENGVLIQIERAEYHYKNGNRLNDEQCFTDAIYRTNQAYEGILKEAYKIFNTTTYKSNPTPFEIESYFIDNHVFTDRVNSLFTHYRTSQIIFQKGRSFFGNSKCVSFYCHFVIANC